MVFEATISFETSLSGGQKNGKQPLVSFVEHIKLRNALAVAVIKW